VLRLPSPALGEGMGVRVFNAINEVFVPRYVDTLKRINRLIEDTLSNAFEGIGKPEPLKENLSGFWSRRIDETNRLVYVVDNDYLTIIEVAVKPCAFRPGM
jgi:Txe/YoeB family toxin of toxin-antitoxin system